MKELTFLVREAEEGGYYAEAASVGIFAEGDTMDELKESIKSGIECYFDNNGTAPAIRSSAFCKR
jgi:predicted RNase H-like HicB family nuclease